MKTNLWCRAGSLFSLASPNSKKCFSLWLLSHPIASPQKVFPLGWFCRVDFPGASEIHSPLQILSACHVLKLQGLQ